MDNLHAVMRSVGNSWTRDVPGALIKAFEPLQAQANLKNGNEIKAEKAIKYGPDERNRLDVYTPAAGVPSARPVVVYFHGGGLVTGDNELTPNIYANLGNYFTKNGYITVLATYRLALQTGHHPNGAEDVTAVLKWVQANIASHGGDPANVVVMGQSAGGYHVLTALFMGYLDHRPEDGAAHPLLRGFISLSAPYTLDVSNPDRNKALSAWFQTTHVPDFNGRFSPVALFRQQYYGTATTPPLPPAQVQDALPCEFRMVLAEYEMEEIYTGSMEFIHEYRKRFGRVPLLDVLKGQNHVSYCFGIGLDAEQDPIYEEAGQKLLKHLEELTR